MMSKKNIVGIDRGINFVVVMTKSGVIINKNVLIIPNSVKNSKWQNAED